MQTITYVAKMYNKNKCCRIVKYFVYVAKTFDFTYDQKCIFGNMSMAKE